MFAEEIYQEQAVQQLEELKSLLGELNTLITKNVSQHKIFTEEYGEIEEITDYQIPYSHYYYEDSDLDGNRVKTFLGYIFCKEDKKIIETVNSINEKKDEFKGLISSLNLVFKKNVIRLRKFVANLDPDGRINLKELTRHIVLINAENEFVKRVSFQMEIINKGKGRCLTAGEISYVIKNYLIGEYEDYDKDLFALRKLKHNELLSPISSNRKKCRANIKIGDSVIKGKYVSIPLLILGEPSKNFKTNIPDLYTKTFKKIRSDQQLEDHKYITFRSFTRKEDQFKTFLSESELEERAEYLDSIFT